MASLHKQAGNRPGYKLRFRDTRGVQRVLWLGSISKRSADGIARHVEELVRAYSNNLQPHADSERWASDLEGRLRERLIALGLAEPVGRLSNVDATVSLGGFLDDYIAGRTDCKSGTVTNFKQTRRLLVELFGVGCPLRGITATDAERWRRWLSGRIVKPATESNPAKTMAVATISKHIKRAKTMFAEAVRDRLLRTSPFADQKGGKESNRERQEFVDQATAQAVLKACPDHDWRLIFALSRYAGMRCPSEVTELKWSDVLWDVGRLRINSPKTGSRFCPIFPELKPILEAAFDDAVEGVTYCVRRYRGSTNLGTQLKRIIEGAGRKPWGKLFINLRSTRRTELQEMFPSHVVDEWLGHSTKTAEEHYLQITADHWASASVAVTGGNAGGNICANPQASTAVINEKIPEKMAVDAARLPGILDKVTPTGFEPVLPP